MTQLMKRHNPLAPLVNSGAVVAHMRTSYGSQRRGMAVLAYLLPVLLVFIGKVFSIPHQDSFSHYYHADRITAPAAATHPWFALVPLLAGLLPYALYYRLPSCQAWRGASGLTSKVAALLRLHWRILVFIAAYMVVVAVFDGAGGFAFLATQRTMRVLFVGTLCAIGAFLYLYRGFTKLESFFLNLAGVAVVLVAMFPMHPDNLMGAEHACDSLCGWHRWHAVSAYGFYGAATLALLFGAFKTLEYYRDDDPDSLRRGIYRALYLICGATMIAAPILVTVAKLWFTQLEHNIFWIEAAGILAFATYWWFKSDELHQSSFEQRVAEGRLDMPASK